MRSSRFILFSIFTLLLLTLGFQNCGSGTALHSDGTGILWGAGNNDCGENGEPYEGLTCDPRVTDPTVGIADKVPLACFTLPGVEPKAHIAFGKQVSAHLLEAELTLPDMVLTGFWNTSSLVMEGENAIPLLPDAETKVRLLSPNSATLEIISPNLTVLLQMQCQER